MAKRIIPKGKKLSKSGKKRLALNPVFLEAKRKKGKGKQMTLDPSGKPVQRTNKSILEWFSRLGIK